jgi:cobalt-zinc-cadmium efflux system outer membrane protein
MAVQMPARAQVAEAGFSLATAESRLLERNREIALARRALAQAGADVRIAGQRPNPQLSFAIQNINPNRGIGNGDLRGKTVDSVVRLDQLIERGNKAELRTETARRLESAAVQDLTDVVRQQLQALRSAYFDLRAAQERLDNAREALQLFARTVDAADKRLKAGDLSGADAARIGVDAARAQNDARAAEADLARAQLAVAGLLAVERDAASLRSTSDWPELAPANIRSLDEIVERRPDVRAAAQRVAAADKARELAQSLGTRDVSVGVQYEHWPNQADANNQGTGNSFGVSMSIPLFLRHRFEGEIARAQADWYAARDAYDRVRGLAAGEVLRAASDLDAARARVERFETELLPKARRSAEAAEFAFRNGAIGVMDLLDARRTFKAIQADATLARADHARAWAAWRAGTEDVTAAVDRSVAGKEETKP